MDMKAAALALFTAPAERFGKETARELFSAFQEETGCGGFGTPEEFLSTLRVELEAMKAKQKQAITSQTEFLAFLENALQNVASAEKSMRH